MRSILLVMGAGYNNFCCYTYKRITHPYLSLHWLYHFAIFHLYDTPTFKTNVLRLVSNGNQEQEKRLLLLYKSLTLVFFGCNW